LQIDTDYELSGGINIDDLDLEIQKLRVLVNFFAISGCNAHLKSEFSPKLLQIDQDNLHIK